jgi:hypothetical protein
VKPHLLPNAAVGSGLGSGLEEGGDGADPGQGGAVLYPGGDPDRLLGRQQIAGRGRLHLSHALEGVLELVQIMRMPAGDDLCTDLERVGAGPGR